MRFDPALVFEDRYGEIVKGCSAEARDIVFARLLDRIGPQVISRVLSEIARHGFLQTGGLSEDNRFPLLRFVDDSFPALELAQSRQPSGLQLSDERAEVRVLYSEIAEQEWNWVSIYLLEDAEALMVISEIESAMRDLHDATQPFGGYCPGAVAEIRGLVETTLDRTRREGGPWVAELLGD